MYGFAGYDHWKTTPPDYCDDIELTPEQEAEQAFDEWMGWQHSFQDNGNYEMLLDEQANLEPEVC